ncbi:MAG: glycosyltransferase family 4 protein [Elusimicrobia bacterium]|nr:glycosyltransferase family 4 protein [Elusimicrobiota bacterium]
MKVLFNVEHPAAWAHGGAQVLVENLMKHLPELGVDVEPVRWWDAEQKGDVLSLFCNPRAAVHYAKRKGLKIVNYVFLDSYSSKTSLGLFARKTFIRGFRTAFDYYATELGWNYPRISDAYVYPSLGDKRLGNYLFGAELERSHVILHGVDDRYFAAASGAHDSSHLISVGTIHPRKNTVLLAEMAKELGVPILFIGKPYFEDDYFRRFKSLVDGKYVLYKGFVEEDEKIDLLSKARGFVLLSLSESGCIAAMEALAAGCPAFLSDLHWAREVYDGTCVFGPLNDRAELKRRLREFFTSPKKLKTFPVSTWKETAGKYLKVYQEVLK